MEYIEYEQYDSPTAYRPARPHPNGWVGNQYTADLIAAHIADKDDEDGWKNRIRNLRIVRLNGSTKEQSKHPKRKARQACYLAIGEVQSVQDYVENVAAVPPCLQVSRHPAVAYEDLWWDCQGGHCKARKGVVGKPYIQFLPPAGPESESTES